MRGTPERRVLPDSMPHGTELGKGRGDCACWSRHDRDGHGAAEADRTSIQRHRRKPVNRERRILEGIKKAHGRVGHPVSATTWDGTDSSTEQSLEGELEAGGAQKGGSGNANPGGASSATRERQEGKGRGDTVRLWTSGILRGVGTARGRDVQPGNRRHEPETRRTPRLAAGCNKPAILRRSKPTRWCETTRSEQDSWHGMPGAEGAMVTSCREWTPESMSMKGR